MAEKAASFAARLKSALAMRKINQSELSKTSGISKSSISRYLSGAWEGKQDAVYMLAKALNVSEAWLMGYDAPIEREPDTFANYSGIKNVIPLPKGTKTVPLYDGIACGEPRYADSDSVGNVRLPDHIRADFAIRCYGDSMINAHIRDGDIVYIRSQPDVDDGEIAAVLIEDEATLKRVYHKPNGVVLMPANDAYEPMIYTADDDFISIRIMGKAVACLSWVK